MNADRIARVLLAVIFVAAVLGLALVVCSIDGGCWLQVLGIDR